MHISRISCQPAVQYCSFEQRHWCKTALYKYSPYAKPSFPSKFPSLHHQQRTILVMNDLTDLSALPHLVHTYGTMQKSPSYRTFASLGNPHIPTSSHLIPSHPIPSQPVPTPKTIHPSPFWDPSRKFVLTFFLFLFLFFPLEARSFQGFGVVGGFLLTFFWAGPSGAAWHPNGTNRFQRYSDGLARICMGLGAKVSEYF